MNNYVEKPTLDFGEAVREAISKLTQFQGRSRRSEFWWSYLAVFLCNIVLGFIPLVGVLTNFLLNLSIVPLIFRRLHDTGRSGWWWGGGFILGVAFAIYFGVHVFVSVAASSAFADPDAANPDAMAKVLMSVLLDPVIIVGYLALLAYGITMLVFLCQDGTPEYNKYGASPKYI